MMEKKMEKKVDLELTELVAQYDFLVAQAELPWLQLIQRFKKSAEEKK